MDHCFFPERYYLSFFDKLKTFVKYVIFNNYVNRCYETNCGTCHIIAQRKFLGFILCTILYGFCIIILRCFTLSLMLSLYLYYTYMYFIPICFNFSSWAAICFNKTNKTNTLDHCFWVI